MFDQRGAGPRGERERADQLEAAVHRLVGAQLALGAQFVDACLDLIGSLPVRWQTRAALINFAEQAGAFDLAAGGRDAEQRVGDMLRMIVATREFQLA